MRANVLTVMVIHVSRSLYAFQYYSENLMDLLKFHFLILDQFFG